MDQVPLELNRRDFTLEERGTTDPEHIRGPEKNLDKRQASIQVCIRVKGDQIVAPTLIFLNDARSEGASVHEKRQKKSDVFLSFLHIRKLSIPSRNQIF